MRLLQGLGLKENLGSRGKNKCKTDTTANQVAAADCSRDQDCSKLWAALPGSIVKLMIGISFLRVALLFPQIQFLGKGMQESFPSVVSSQLMEQTTAHIKH